jgi:peptidoglycan/LPS O-acetylase OafA/YrhL
LIDQSPIEFIFEDFLNIFFDPLQVFYHFWYIGIITSIYLFYPLLLKIFKRFKDHLFHVLLVSILIQIIYDIFLPTIVNNLETLQESFFLYYYLKWLLQYLFFRFIAFFTLGVYISKNYDKIILKIKFLYLSIIPIIIYTIINEFVFREALEPFFSIFIILFFLSLLINKRSYFLEEISKYSYGIYLIHGLILFYIGSTLIQYSNYWFFYLYAFILTFSISFIIIYSLSKIPKSQYLIGYQRKN